MNTLYRLVALIYLVVGARWYHRRWRLAALLACWEIRVDAVVLVGGTTYFYFSVLLCP